MDWNLFSGHGVVCVEFHKCINKLECGPMPKVMVALPNIGGALCLMCFQRAACSRFQTCILYSH